jgi:hypothetical protein
MTVVPFADSEELIRNSKLSDQMLIPVGDDHRLATPEALSMMLDAVRLWTPSEVQMPGVYDARVTEADGVVLDLIHAELAKPDLTEDRREELEWLLSWYADKYCSHWLDDERRRQD